MGEGNVRRASVCRYHGHFGHRDHYIKVGEHSVASIEERVKEIIVKQLGVEEDEVGLDAPFIENLGADSLDTVELVMAFEEEFYLEIRDEDAEGISNSAGGHQLHQDSRE